MKVLSHRGYWKTAQEKNTKEAFERSLTLGFGMETDIRDLAGELVMSHDMPLGSAMTLKAYLDIVNSFKKEYTLALNIKADGLATALKCHLSANTHLDCFVFDMSVPDMLGYFKENIPVFARMSEVEKNPSWVEKCTGIWLDAFELQWYDTALINKLLKQNLRVCIVSPELHGREFRGFWNDLYALRDEPRLMICTDHPEEAQRFFERDQ
ncbi:MAG: hypothetical protein ACRCWR_04300 [Saezia sp.]